MRTVQLLTSTMEELKLLKERLAQEIQEDEEELKQARINSIADDIINDHFEEDLNMKKGQLALIYAAIAFKNKDDDVSVIPNTPEKIAALVNKNEELQAKIDVSNNLKKDVLSFLDEQQKIKEDKKEKNHAILHNNIAKIAQVKRSYHTVKMENLSPRKKFMGWLLHHPLDSKLATKKNKRKDQMSHLENVCYALKKNKLPDLPTRELFYELILNITLKIGIEIEFEGEEIDTIDRMNQSQQEDLIRLTKSLILLGTLRRTISDIDKETNLAPSRLKYNLNSLCRKLEFDIIRITDGDFPLEDVHEKSDSAYKEFTFEKQGAWNKVKVKHRMLV